MHGKYDKYEEYMISMWSAWKQFMDVIFYREQLEGHSFFCLNCFPKRNPTHIVRIPEHAYFEFGISRPIGGNSKFQFLIESS